MDVYTREREREEHHTENRNELLMVSLSLLGSETTGMLTARKSLSPLTSIAASKACSSFNFSTLIQGRKAPGDNGSALTATKGVKEVPGSALTGTSGEEEGERKN